MQGKGFNDAHDYFVQTYGESEGKSLLQKLQGSVSICFQPKIPF